MDICLLFIRQFMPHQPMKKIFSAVFSRIYPMNLSDYPIWTQQKLFNLTGSERQYIFLRTFIHQSRSNKSLSLWARKIGEYNRIYILWINLKSYIDFRIWKFFYEKYSNERCIAVCQTASIHFSKEFPIFIQFIFLVEREKYLPNEVSLISPSSPNIRKLGFSHQWLTENEYNFISIFFGMPLLRILSRVFHFQHSILYITSNCSIIRYTIPNLFFYRKNRELEYLFK